MCKCSINPVFRFPSAVFKVSASFIFKKGFCYWTIKSNVFILQYNYHQQYTREKGLEFYNEHSHYERTILTKTENQKYCRCRHVIFTTWRVQDEYEMPFLFVCFSREELYFTLGKIRFFLGGGRAGASEGRVISESEH